MKASELRQFFYNDAENPFQSEMLDAEAHETEMKRILSYRYGEAKGYLIPSATVKLLREVDEDYLKRLSRMRGFDRQMLLNAKERGIDKIPEITRIESQRLGFPANLCRDYLTKHICYELGESEIAGLKKFYELAVKYDLAQPDVKLRFV